MSSDRFYMRDDYPRQQTTALVWLIAAMIAAFVIQLVLLSPWFGSSASIPALLSLTPRAVQQWHLWTLLTHGFLHSTANPLHIFFSIISLVLIGRELEPQLGARRFLGVFAGSLVMGALFWLACHWRLGGMQGHIGPSAGIMGLLVVLACLYSRQQMSFMPFFIFSVTVRPLYFVYGLLAIDVFLLVLYELPGASAPFAYSPSAHLGGMFAGWLYFRFLHASRGWDRASGFSLPAWLRFRRPKASPTTRRNRPIQNLRVEVDRILDKINSQGFGSLTEEEKRILDDAKDLLSKR
jgi:membrane associated rhomboid family serine protease